MKAIKLITILVFLMPIIVLAKDDPTCKYYGIHDEETKKIFELENQAAISINYSPYDKKLDINIGELDGNARTPITFSLAELKYFFESQKHKELIVVWFDKFAPEDINVSAHIEELNNYFFAKSYKRVLLLQGLGSGVGLYTDKINQNYKK